GEPGRDCSEHDQQQDKHDRDASPPPPAGPACRDGRGVFVLIEQARHPPEDTGGLGMLAVQPGLQDDGRGGAVDDLPAAAARRSARRPGPGRGPVPGYCARSSLSRARTVGTKSAAEISSGPPPIARSGLPPARPPAALASGSATSGAVTPRSSSSLVRATTTFDLPSPAVASTIAAGRFDNRLRSCRASSRSADVSPPGWNSASTFTPSTSIAASRSRSSSPFCSSRRSLPSSLSSCLTRSM